MRLCCCDAAVSGSCGVFEDDERDIDGLPRPFKDVVGGKGTSYGFVTIEYGERVEGKGTLLVARISSCPAIEPTRDPRPQILARKGETSAPMRCRVRLIYKGKLLANDQVVSTVVGDDDVVHYVLSPVIENVGDLEDPESGRTGARGFDSLRDHGFSDDDIGALRSLFSLEIHNLVERTPRRPGESDVVRRRRIEDVWVQQHLRRFVETAETFGSSERGTSSIGANTDFFVGVMLGYFLGFLMMFWVGDSGISSRRRNGIIVGVGIHIFWTLSHPSPVDPFLDMA